MILSLALPVIRFYARVNFPATMLLQTLSNIMNDNGAPDLLNCIHCCHCHGCDVLFVFPMMKNNALRLVADRFAVTIVFRAIDLNYPVCLL